MHIGQSKAGSTSFQVFLDRHSELLKSQGMRFLEAGRPTSKVPSHYNLQHDNLELPRCLEGEDNLLVNEADRQWDVALDEINYCKEKKVILSCEAGWLLSDASVEYMSEKLKKFDVYVIVVFRDPFHYIVSSYKQNIKTGWAADSLSDFYHRRAPLLDYKSVVRRWESRKCVKGVNKIMFKEGQDIIPIVLGALGLPCHQIETSSRENTSEKPELLWIVRSLNKLESKFANKRSRILCRKIRREILRRRDSLVAQVASKLPLQLFEEGELELIQRHVENDTKSRVPASLS